MARAPGRSKHTILLFPLILLTVSLLEEIGWAYLRTEIRSIVLRVVLRLVLVGGAFSVASELVEPFLRGLFTRARNVTKRGVGPRFGPWPFYVVAYGLLFAAYYVAETRGVRVFLP